MMSARFRRHALLPLLPLIIAGMAPWLLAGCGRDDYPALTIRPEERNSGSLPPVPGPSPYATPLAITPMSSADLAIRLNQLVADAGHAHQAFLAQRAGTDAAIAAAQGSGVATENWSVATQALSRMVVAQGPVVAALAELERLHEEDRVAHAIPDGNAGAPEKRPDALAIINARAHVVAMMDEENAVLAGFHARLPD